MSEHAYSTWSDGKKIKSTEVMQEFANTLGAVNNDGFYNLVPADFVVYKRTTGHTYVIDYSARLTSGGSTRANDYADDATAIQAAIDGAAALSNGGKIHIMAGSYTINTVLTITRNIVIEGEYVPETNAGASSTTGTRLILGAAVNMFNCVAAARTPATSRYYSVQLRNLGLHGNGQATIIFNAKWADNINFENVHIINAYGGAIYAEECWDWSFKRCFFTASGTSGGANVIEAYNGATDNSNHWHFSQCRWENNRGVGFYSDATGGGSANHRMQFNQCKFEGTGSNLNIFIGGTLDNSTIAESFFQNGKTAVYAVDLLAGSERNIITASIFYNNGRDIRIVGDYNTIAHCKLRTQIDAAAHISINGNGNEIEDNWKEDANALVTIAGGTGNVVLGRPLYQNSGSVTMAAGTTTVTQAHGLAGTPNGELSFNANWNSGEIWAGAGVTDLTIYCENAPDSDSPIYWSAEYKP